MNSDDHINAMHERDIEEAMKEFAELPQAKLERMRRDEALPEFEREAAGRLYDVRQAAIDEIEARGREKQAEFEKAVEARKEARRLAREKNSGQEEPETVSAATGQRRGSEGLSKNRVAAETFADMLADAGLNAKARPTQRIQGRDVRDGWTVNVRDDEHEIGIVACWWGRDHFTCFLEIAGHVDRSAEGAVAVLAGLRAAVDFSRD